MKLAACYTVFNGTELLQKSIDQIYDHVDEIIIYFQRISNKGNYISESAVIDLLNISVNENFRSVNNNRQKKIHLFEFNVDLSKNTKENERNKHQKMLEMARLFKCTHFFMAATDHFYLKNEFIFGKNTCQIHDYDVTFTKMFTYYKDPTWQLTPIESYYMPFIMKIKNNTAIERAANYPVLVDPSVQISGVTNFYVFEECDLMLHHYSMIRENINDKFKNAAASMRWTNGLAEKFEDEFNSYDIIENPGIEYFQGRKIKIVPDHFKLCQQKTPI